MRQKVVLYQVFTRLHTNRNKTRKPGGTIQENGCGKMEDFSPKMLRLIHEMGITHVWYTGIIRHATQTDYSAYGIPRQHPAVVKGRAGSPYAITDYYDVDPDLAVNVDRRMEEFEKLVVRTHRAAMKIIIDFVPNHVARQYHSICKPQGVADLGENDDPTNGFEPRRNNFYYCPGERFAPGFDLQGGEASPYEEMPAKATGNDCFNSHPGVNDWYETVKLNYGVDYYAGGINYFSPVPDTWHKMLDILLFWAGKGVDGFRCDMAEMVPPEFWEWAIGQVKERFPKLIFIGEVYDPGKYRRYVASGFDFLYDKVGMYDVLRDVICGRRDTSAITWAWQQNDDIADHMLYFLENHDEQRIASDFFAGNAAKGVPALVVGALLRQAPFMIYGGQEWGEAGMDAEGFSGTDGRSTIFDYWSLHRETANRELAELYSKVLNIALKERVVRTGQMYDIMHANPELKRQYAFIRCLSLTRKEQEVLLVVANFENVPVQVNLVVPGHAFDYLRLPARTVHATELLTGNRMIFKFQRDTAIRKMTVPAQGALIFKFD